MNEQQQKPEAKKAEPDPPTPDRPPAGRRQKVRVRWALGGPIVDAEFDPATGLVHCMRNGKKVRISIHGPVIHWIEDPV